MSAPSLDVLRASPPGEAGATCPGAGAAPATVATAGSPARATPAAPRRGPLGAGRGVAPRAGSARRARALLGAVCAHFGVEPREWQGRRAGGQPLWALRYATYLICSEVDLPGARLAALLGKDRTTLLYHWAVMAQFAPDPLHARRLAAIRGAWRAMEQCKEQGPHSPEEEAGGAER